MDRLKSFCHGQQNLFIFAKLEKNPKFQNVQQRWSEPSPSNDADKLQCVRVNFRNFHSTMLQNFTKWEDKVENELLKKIIIRTLLESSSDRLLRFMV